MRLLAENRTLQQKNADLMAATSKKRRKGGEENPTGLDYKGEVIRWAKEFLLTQALFIDITAFAANPGEPELSANPEDQLSTNEAYTQSLTTALYATIPVKFHSLVDAREYGGFARDVRIRSIRALKHILTFLSVHPRAWRWTLESHQCDQEESPSYSQGSQH